MNFVFGLILFSLRFTLLKCCVSTSGGYDMEEKAARSYDLAALKYWGPSTHTNFPV